MRTGATNPSRENRSAEALPTKDQRTPFCPGCEAELRGVRPAFHTAECVIRDGAKVHEQRPLTASELEAKIAAKQAERDAAIAAFEATGQRIASTLVPPISAWDARPYGPFSGDESPGTLEHVAADFRAEKARQERADRRFFWALTAGLCCIAAGISLMLLAMLRS